MTMAVKLTEENLEQIARYLADRFPVLKMRGGGRNTSRTVEMELLERTIRVEEELKNQRDLMREMMLQMDRRFDQIDKRFEQVEKRFEQIDKRFEQVDKRFEQVDKRFEQVDKHFQQVDKRFEMIDKRFEDIHSRFTMMMWFIGIGFTLVTAFITGSMAFFR